MTLPTLITGRMVAASAAAVLLFAHTVSAQVDTPQPPKAVIVHDTSSANEWHGVLTHLDAERATIIVGSEQRQLLLKDVLSIETEGDSVRNGAIIGAIVGTVFCAMVCGQGLDDASSYPLVVAANGAMIAAIGASIDAMIPGRTSLYRQPRDRTRSRKPALSWTWRF